MCCWTWICCISLIQRCEPPFIYRFVQVKFALDKRNKYFLCNCKEYINYNYKIIQNQNRLQIQHFSCHQFQICYLTKTAQINMTYTPLMQDGADMYWVMTLQPEQPWDGPQRKMKTTVEEGLRLWIGTLPWVIRLSQLLPRVLANQCLPPVSVSWGHKLSVHPLPGGLPGPLPCCTSAASPSIVCRQ